MNRYLFLLNGEKAQLFWNESPKCTCGFPVENRLHMILDCSNYDDLRNFCVEQMVTTITSVHPWVIPVESIRSRTAMAHLILDPSWFRRDIGSSGRGLPNIMSKETTDKLESIGRTFCYQLYKRRFSILSEEDEESETDDSSSYSLHDTSEESGSEDSILSDSTYC